MELGRFVLHRSGEEGIDELGVGPFRAFSIPIEDFYESRYIKYFRPNDARQVFHRIAHAMTRGAFGQIPVFCASNR